MTVQNKRNTLEKEDVVIKFVGDSGDGMQLMGSIFSETIALSGNDLATFPDFPAEIRAPRNTVAGVSGYQIHFGHRKVLSPGDLSDVLVAFNPASLKANLKWVKKGGTIMVDESSFDEKILKKAGFDTNPLEDNSLSSFNVIRFPLTQLTRDSVADFGFIGKAADKMKNMFVLGMLYNMFDKNIQPALDYFEKKFQKKPELIKSNSFVIQTGYQFASTIEAIPSFVIKKTVQEPGVYKNIHGNEATAWGLMAAAEKSGLQLFLGSYPITPATEILSELSKHRALGIKTFQAEDEIAGITSAIGASFAGALACTTTSGPGLSLKSEAMGLAIITELPLVIVNVQRGGPSTGLPTKSEQADLLQAIYGRNGESPLIVIAASSPVDCFYSAYEASRLSLENMTPVILLSDGYIGFGSEVMKIPKMSEMPEINVPFAKENTKYQPYDRNEETLVRNWAVPGMEGLRHRLGGLEKTNGKGEVSTDPKNHELMVKIREEKVQKLALRLPDQEVYGDKDAELLIVSWGGTKGQIQGAVDYLRKEGHKIAQAHFKYINPLPKNTIELLLSYKNVMVCELNSGQFASYLRIKHPEVSYLQYNKVQGQPFTVSELSKKFTEILNS